jgi:DNA-3-methyladenine glycosylase I
MVKATRSQPLSLERCPWPGIADPQYTRYHDEEWGVPLTDSRALFEKIVLEGFQSGLSWLTILKKRENFRRAFENFEAETIARYAAKDIARLMADDGIVRNKLKIEATIDNAKAYLALSQRQSFAAFTWGLVDLPPRQSDLQSLKGAPAQTVASMRVSKALKREGFRFVGPTTVYAFMQSSGMVNDHLVSCYRHDVCAKLQKAMTQPPEQ